MKRGILTDLHSTSPFDFIQSMKGIIDDWAFLGDYDDPKLLKGLIALGGDRILTIGNHDYFFALRAPHMSFTEEGSLRWNELVYSWGESEEETDFVGYCVEDIEGAREGVRVLRDGKFGKVLYTHSKFSQEICESLSDRLGPSRGRFSVPEDNLAAKLNSDDGWVLSLRENFQEMVRRDVGVMFRGHDHGGFYGGYRICSADRDGRNIEMNSVGYDERFVFNANKRYVVSVGPFSVGDYAVFDEDANSVEFGDRNRLKLVAPKEL